MIAGHFGLAAAVKARERQVPLWALMLATVWLDIVFIPLLVAGAETIDEAPGTDGGYGNMIIHADYTHSLVGAALLSVLFGVVAARWWGQRSGIVLGVVAFSHWLLDLIVHRPDLPILPGNAGDLPLLGLGLWRERPATILVELVLVVLGSYLYWRAATETAQRAGSAAEGRARLLGVLMLVAGIATLAVDVLVG